LLQARPHRCSPQLASLVQEDVGLPHGRACTSRSWYGSVGAGEIVAEAALQARARSQMKKCTAGGEAGPTVVMTARWAEWRPTHRPMPGRAAAARRSPRREQRRRPVSSSGGSAPNLRRAPVRAQDRPASPRRRTADGPQPQPAPAYPRTGLRPQPPRLFPGGRWPYGGGGRRRARAAAPPGARRSLTQGPLVSTPLDPALTPTAGAEFVEATREPGRH